MGITSRKQTDRERQIAAVRRVDPRKLKECLARGDHLYEGEVTLHFASGYWFLGTLDVTGIIGMDR